MKIQAPFGSWQSPITAKMVAGKTPKIFDTLIDNGRLFWSESIAAEKGRSAIMMHDGNQHQCILPRPLSAKSRVHEYGGASYTVHENTLYFVLDDDQGIYAGDFSKSEFTPVALTPKGDFRFADLIVDKKNHRIIAVCEEHVTGSEQRVDNYLVSIPIVSAENSNQALSDVSDDSTKISAPDETISSTRSLIRLTEGHDFYSNPCISPDGDQIIWLTWDNPDMPWDNTQLWLADINATGLDNIRLIAGNGAESIFQPQWSPDGDVYFVSDRNNWWNLYSIKREALNNGKPKATCTYAIEAEFATPQWVFGMSTYGFIDAKTILATFTQDGTWKLVKILLPKECEPEEQGAEHKITIETIESTLTDIEYISTESGFSACIGASPTQAKSLFLFSDGQLHKLDLSVSDSNLSPDDYSRPQAIEFKTSENQYARALFYPPHNSQYENTDSLPPLIVISHGGPTGASESSLNLKIQYWTSRGFAVADVNYRGSTGYGREFRHRLFNQWGVYDVDDVCAVVEHLADQRLIDKNKCIIKGSSAGGYTVLAALTYRDTFKAGVSLYGIGDLEMLANDTHKFEARYLDKLIGPYPESAAVYRSRSPIHHVDQINCPLLVFQGLLDKVVPPNQAEDMVNAVREKGLPVAYVTYANEAHGFRQPETIEHMLDSELQFYSKVFNFDAGSILYPLAIDNI